MVNPAAAGRPGGRTARTICSADPRGAHPRGAYAQNASEETPMSAQARPLVHTDIKPSATSELASHYIDAPNMPWEPTKFPGIRIKVLYSDDDGVTTALFRLEPGAVVP